MTLFGVFTARRQLCCVCILVGYGISVSGVISCQIRRRYVFGCCGSTIVRHRYYHDSVLGRLLVIVVHMSCSCHTSNWIESSVDIRGVMSLYKY